VISLREIEAIVREDPASFRPKLIEPLGMAGGMSGAQFWRLESAGGVFVLRQWPSEHPSLERLRFIHDVLFFASEHGSACLALPIRTSSGESFVLHAGHLWELTPWMPGAADYEELPNEQKLRAAMTMLGSFHRATSGFPRAATQVLQTQHAVLRHLTRLQQLLSEGTEDMSSALRTAKWPELNRSARDFLTMLPKLLPHAIARLAPQANLRLPVQPCLRDIWHDHVLFTGDKVTGIIDFGAVDTDTPATDIARLLGSLAGDDATGWRVGIEAYSTIRPLSADEELAARALDASGTILAGCNWLRWIYLENREFEEREKILERFRRIVARCAARI